MPQSLGDHAFLHPQMNGQSLSVIEGQDTPVVPNTADQDKIDAHHLFILHLRNQDIASVASMLDDHVAHFPATTETRD